MKKTTLNSEPGKLAQAPIKLGTHFVRREPLSRVDESHGVQATKVTMKNQPILTVNDALDFLRSAGWQVCYVSQEWMVFATSPDGQGECGWTAESDADLVGGARLEQDVARAVKRSASEHAAACTSAHPSAPLEEAYRWD